MSHVAFRLRRAMDRSDISGRKLSAALVKMGVKGASRPSISDYLKVKTEPSIEFLRGAAKALGVSFEWLATGQDPSPQHDVRDIVLKRHEVLGTLSIGVQQTFLDLVVACWHQALDHTGSSPEATEIVRDEMVAISDDLIRLLTLPLGCWGLRELGELELRERHTYFYHALGAYSQVVRRRTGGHRVADRSTGFSDELMRLVDDEHARLHGRVESYPRSDVFVPA